MQEKYSIKDLELISGIKAHTLRIWEQRYCLLEPQRSHTNIRFYSNDDLKKILNISLLNKNGIKISKIAGFKDYEISEKIKALYLKDLNHNDQINALIVSMIDLDENQFNQIISSNIIQIGFHATIEKVVFPFLQKTGIMWQAGSINPAQEHFISNLIRQKIISAIDVLNAPKIENPKNIVFYLPEGELHELSLLFYNYLIKSKGHKCIYLGQSVPMDDMKTVCRICKADSIVGVITQPLKEYNTEKYLKELSAAFPSQKIFLSGLQLINHSLKTPKNIVLFKSAEEFKSLF